MVIPISSIALGLGSMQNGVLLCTNLRTSSLNHNIKESHLMMSISLTVFLTYAVGDGIPI